MKFREGPKIVQVKEDTKQASLRTLISMIHGNELRAQGVKPETIGITLGDISDLAKLVWPKGNWWWSEFIGTVPNELKPVLLAQHPVLSEIHVQGVEESTFETWLTTQAERFGAWFEIKAVEQ